MAMNRADFRKQLQEGLNTVFGMEYARYPEEWKYLFAIERSVKAFEEDVLLAGFDAAPVKPEGEGVAYDEGAESYVARYTHETIALAFSITEEAEEDGLYGSIGSKYARALARSLQQTKEVKGADILNNGFDATFPGGDGVPLFSASHPQFGGGVQATPWQSQLICPRLHWSRQPLTSLSLTMTGESRSPVRSRRWQCRRNCSSWQHASCSRRIARARAITTSMQSTHWEQWLTGSVLTTDLPIQMPGFF